MTIERLITNVIFKQASEEDQRKLQAWINKNPLNKMEFEEAKSLVEREYANTVEFDGKYRRLMAKIEDRLDRFKYFRYIMYNVVFYAFFLILAFLLGFFIP